MSLNETKQMSLKDTIKELKEKIVKAIEESHLDPSIIELVLNDFQYQIKMIILNSTTEVTFTPEEENQNGEHINPDSGD